MEIYQAILILLLHKNTVFTKKYASSSDESIENLLYYKDCQKDKNIVVQETTAKPLERMMLSQPQPRAMECPFPKMCCALTCGNECGSSPRPFNDNVEMMDRIQAMQPPMQPAQPQAMRVRKRVKRPPGMQNMQPPIGARRDFGFTKDRIKSLINQDDDIRKILKDLVRVTMQKVDLVDMMNTRRATVTQSPHASHTYPKVNREDDDDDNDDLE